MYNKVMIVMYTSSGCGSCRKAKQWLIDHNLKFIEKNIFNMLLNKDEIKYLLKRSDFGTDDIISKRSKIISESKINIDDMTIDELCDFVTKNPSVLKRPIIIDDKNMQVGYDENDIETFIPRNIQLDNHCEGDKCPHYQTCGKIRAN